MAASVAKHEQNLVDTSGRRLEHDNEMRVCQCEIGADAQQNIGSVKPYVLLGSQDGPGQTMGRSEATLAIERGWRRGIAAALASGASGSGGGGEPK